MVVFEVVVFLNHIIQVATTTTLAVAMIQIVDKAIRKEIQTKVRIRYRRPRRFL